jgi:gamma-glutamyl hercynylcysteine S-oxide synthase
MLVTQDSIATDRPLGERLSDARCKSDDLFRIVRDEAFYDRPIPERHRIVFYVGHLEAFDWNLLRERAFGLKGFCPEFDRLFAFGIDPVGGGLPADQPSDWPRMNRVQDYVGKVRNTIDEHLEDLAGHGLSGEVATLLNVAIEHRLMHAETLAYMLHQLPFDRKVPQPQSTDLIGPSVQYRMVDIPAGRATLGLKRDSCTFGWDNEFEAHSEDVPAFTIDQFMVTNRKYLEFLLSGGYETRSFWSDEDWQWKTAQSISHPVFWKKDRDQWLYQTMFSEVPLPLEWPVYVSHAEAAAYAQWAKKSLPTEAEWHRAAYGADSGDVRMYPWGDEAPAAHLGNFDFQHWNPKPVNASPAGASAYGIHGMLGNGWEWTSTVFSPFQGFKAFTFYPGYSADFFDGKHFVMKGGSARTAACMLRPTFRNWFQAHYQYVYAGFRCVSR